MGYSVQRYGYSGSAVNRTFKEWEAILSRGRNGIKKLGNNTYLERIGADTLGVKLHNTYVVEIHSDDTYTLNSGGWRTLTTKERINSYSPARISQESGLWYLYTDKDKFLFSDGIKIDTKGYPIGNVESPDDTEALKKKLDRMVSKYIKGFVDSAMEAKGIKNPGPGDCFGCQFHASNPDASDPFKGNEVMGLNHLIQHFNEKYFVPSLLFKAIQEQGYRDPAFIWHFIKSDLETGRKPYHMSNALRRYFQRRKVSLLKELKGEIAKC